MFRKIHLPNVINSSVEKPDEKGIVDTIFCNFQKALDLFPHKSLIDILSFCRVRNPLSTWVKSFLSDQKHVVSVNGSVSESFKVLFGVPKVTVLGASTIHCLQKLYDQIDFGNLHLSYIQRWYDRIVLTIT